MRRRRRFAGARSERSRVASIARADGWRSCCRSKASMTSVLEDHKDDPVYSEITAFIGALTEDEQIDLVALAWLGRGDGTIEDWSELRAQAASEHNRRTARYLLGLPLLADYLEEGLSA